MFLHSHPYEPFLFEDATRWIVGTLPPPRFTTGDLKPGDVDFCYGSRDGQLWTILDRIYGLDLRYENKPGAIKQRKDFLRAHRIGICDIVHSARRIKMDASDLGMQEVKLRDLIKYLQRYPKVTTLLFTGGNSKNGPEYFFRRQLRQYGIPLKVVSDKVPRIHQFELDIHGREKGTKNLSPPRVLTTVSLTAPSGAANRAIGSLREYKSLKKQNPELSTLDFRVLQYTQFFKQD